MDSQISPHKKELKMNLRYSVLIQWSDEDKKYIASLPEFGPYVHTHGNTYEETAKSAQEVLELLVRTYEEQSRSLPVPSLIGIGEPEWPEGGSVDALAQSGGEA